MRKGTSFAIGFSIMLAAALATIFLFSAAGSAASAECWQYYNDSACSGVTGCQWHSESSFGGWCERPGCWDHWNQTTCTADPECEWKTDVYGSWCEEKGCWDHNNQSGCTTAGCLWESSGWCEEEGCWNYWDNQTACDLDTNCEWDSGGNYCYEPGPWNYNNQTSCTGAGYTWEDSGWCQYAGGCWEQNTSSGCTAISGCEWDSNWGHCYELGCWDYDVQSDCLADAEGYGDCEWDDYSAYCYEVGCWDYSNMTSCNAHNSTNNGTCAWNGNETSGWCEELGPWNYGDNQTVCEEAGYQWKGEGWCKEYGCWDYWDQTDCTTDPDGYGNCEWDTEWNYCYEKPLDCWEYSGSSSCEEQTGCTWKDQGGWCYKPGCWDFDYTNESACVNNTYNLSCTWNDPWCGEAGCWSYGDDATCLAHAAQGCEWKEPESDWGWCEEVGCWTYDNDKAGCENANATIGKDCYYDDTENLCDPLDCWIYDGDEAGCLAANTTIGIECEYENGWCDPAGGGCAEFDGNEYGCYDTMWCMWDPIDQLCDEPEMTGPMMNPGCWVFDSSQTDCEKTDLCVYCVAGTSDFGVDNETSPCYEEDTNVCEDKDVRTGENRPLQCANITDKNLCNTLPMFSTCCAWEGGECQQAPYSTECWDNMQPPPEGAMFCEDYNALSSETVCNQIAASPWFMPCEWNNVTSQCQFKFDDAFGGEMGGFMDIDTKKNCEFAGGVWKVETWYDEGTGTMQTDEWCEMGFGVGYETCDTMCWACEFQDNGSAWNSASEAQTACEGSALGFCEFHADSYAFNGYGWCEPKHDMFFGGTSCSQDCWSCFNKDKCEASTAGCKWFTDPVDSTMGWCDKNTVKSCKEDCWQCFDETSCKNTGLGGGGNCKWDSNNYYCKPSNFDNEICFDGIDNDNNFMIDCADPFCMFDPFCGGNMISDCGKYIQQANCEADPSGDCIWIEDSVTGGSWCGRKGENCWMHKTDETACDAEDGCGWHQSDKGFCDINETKASQCFTISKKANCKANSDCSWIDEPWSPNGGFCDFKVFSCFELSKSDCGNGEYTYCAWEDDPFSPQGGWCDPKCFSDAYNPPDGNNASCVGDSYCDWIHGRCEPDMFMMEDCFQYDGNQTACETNNATCAWHSEEDGMCDVDESAECWKYQKNDTCSAAGCEWMTDNWGNEWCENKFFTCFKYDGDQTGCEARAECMWFASEQICDPVCFNESLDQSGCTAINGCMWATGYCDPKMIGEMFKGIEAGAPVILGMDQCPEGGIDGQIDICGFGIKEMPDSYGLGTKVEDIADAAICNGEPIWDGMGSGYEPTKFYWYLDTDGDDDNNCDSHDGEEEGFEFFLKYEVEWIDGGLSEKKVAYKCVNNSWAPTPIPLSNWKKIMCNEVEGGILAVDKAALKKFTTLFDITKDMRIYATTAGANSDKANPADSVGPAYYTPGSVDFKFEDCMAIGVDMDGDGFTSESDPDCMAFKKFGYIPFEDCWDGVDNNGDGLTDCADPACEWMPHCEGTFAADPNDTTAPKVTWKSVDKFTDFALVMVDTNEPTNGTLLFYNTTSKCKTNATSILDPALENDFTMDDYRVWHDFPIEDLSANTTYFYKVKLYDPSGNIKISACLNFTTPVNDTEFMVGFDFDPIAEHDFLNDINYKINDVEFDFKTKGKKGTKEKNINLSIGNPNATKPWEMEFKGAKFTKAKDFNITDSLLAGESAGKPYVGMDHNKWLELVQNLGIDSIIITLPLAGDILYHCDDNGENCEDITDFCEFIDSTTSSSTWECPVSLGFSTYSVGQSTTSQGDDGAGAGGGGGGAVTNVTPPAAPFCGDGTCDVTESMSSCCADCGCLSGYECQGGVCVKKVAPAPLPEEEIKKPKIVTQPSQPTAPSPAAIWAQAEYWLLIAGLLVLIIGGAVLAKKKMISPDVRRPPGGHEHPTPDHHRGRPGSSHSTHVRKGEGDLFSDPRFEFLKDKFLKEN